MIRAHKIRLNPTPDQQTDLMKAAGTARFVYNWSVAQWRAAQAKKPTLRDLRKRFEAEQPDWMREVTPCAAQGAFAEFGRTLKNHAAGRIDEPQFKKRSHGVIKFRLSKNNVDVRGHWLRLPHMEPINLAEPLRFAGKILGATVSKEADGWSISIHVKLPDAHVLSKMREVDVRRLRLAILNDKTLFESLRPLRTALGRLASLQRLFATKQQGSKNHAKLNQKIARLYVRIRNIRNDIANKLTAWITERYEPETALAGLTQNHSHSPEVATPPDKKVPSVNEALLRIVHFFLLSKTCPECGCNRADSVQSDRVFVCPCCGFTVEFEHNAILTALDEGLRVAALNAPSDSGYDGRESPPQTGYNTICIQER